MPSSVVVSGQNSMKYGEEQTLTVNMEPQNMLEKNQAVTWGIVEGVDNAEIVSSRNTEAVIRAVGVGEAQYVQRRQMDYMTVFSLWWKQL